MAAAAAERAPLAGRRALVGHYLNGLIEMWLAGVPIPMRPDWAQAHCAAEEARTADHLAEH
jgi:hypothetical protein